MTPRSCSRKMKLRRDRGQEIKRAVSLSTCPAQASPPSEKVLTSRRYSVRVALKHKKGKQNQCTASSGRWEGQVDVLHAGVHPRKRKPGPSFFSDVVRTEMGPCKEKKEGRISSYTPFEKGRGTHHAGTSGVHDSRPDDISRAADGCRGQKRRCE